MLHGCKQDPDDFATGTNMNAISELNGMLVAYPRRGLARPIRHRVGTGLTADIRGEVPANQRSFPELRER